MIDPAEVAVTTEGMPSTGQKSGLHLTLDFDGIHIEDEGEVIAVGDASGGSGYKAVATNDGQIRFLIGSSCNLDSWKRLPFLDFSIGDKDFEVKHVAIGGDCSGNSHPYLLAYSDGDFVHAFQWSEWSKRWKRVGGLQSKKGYGWTITQFQWESDDFWGWSLYVGGRYWGHQRLRPSRWYEFWWLWRWVRSSL